MKASARLSAGFWVVGLTAVPASAQITINEVLGSTTGSDTEFIELYNAGGSTVDIGDWVIELWDSDSGGPFGGSDAGSPYTIPTGATLASGDWFLMANTLAESAFGVTADLSIQANAIENSSYTMILKDDLGSTIESIFVTDGGAGDAANDAGTLITEDLSVGPDGTFLPAGFFRIGDASPSVAFLEFSPVPAPSATPGAANIPEPGALVLMGLGGLGLLRRRG